jgi:heme-degrading monooxygenase HmoA
VQTHHLAQINIARLTAPLDDPRIAEFVEQLEPINKLADSSPGFISRLQSEQGNATDLAYSDDPFIIVNMSVWDSIEALKEFTYRSRHLHVLRDRKKWFEKMELPHYCLWWVPIGHRPAIAEGRTKLELYQRYGSTVEAFWFNEWYPAPAAGLVSA